MLIPALIIPAVAILGSLVLKNLAIDGQPLIDPKNATLVSLALGALAALAVALPMLRPAPAGAAAGGPPRCWTPWGGAALLPQTLAALGAVFALAGVGDVVGRLIGQAIPLDNRLAVTMVFTLGMAGFTAVMGNAFAAFPVMTAAIGLPLIVRRFGGDPAIMGAIGMLAGFCGTLVTPMAANFNIVPVRLLELTDRWAVIRAQAPRPRALLAVNTALMYLLVFRF